MVTAALLAMNTAVSAAEAAAVSVVDSPAMTLGLADLAAALQDVVSSAADVGTVVASAFPPALSTPVATTGFVQMTGPWIAGTLYGVVPTAPLTAVPSSNKKWFAITHGKYVGLTKNSAISLNAVNGISSVLSDRAFLGVPLLPPTRLDRGPAPLYAPFQLLFPLAYFMASPPPYVDPQFERLLDALERFDLSNSANLTSSLAFTTPSASSVVPPPVLPRTARSTRTSSILPPVLTGVCIVINHPSSPGILLTGLASSPGFRDEATRATQGVAGGIPQLLTPSRKSQRSKKGAYAVFHGRVLGVYINWAEAKINVNGVPGSLFQGYRCRESAQAAYDYAHARSWTRVCGSLSPSAGPPHMIPALIPAAPIPALPTPVGFLDAPNPLHDAGDVGDSCWYVVYCGITLGVYQSTLECALNTVALSGAVHDSCTTKEMAVLRYQNALQNGRVEVLSHAYQYA
ncbi:hypothetical protein B0H17DRAFT_1242322 [Mycena rosella]|uniref:Ribonuclease H1 N-terminal domain-containing protein n=1 Tax=Mycena rosella TaxID=1033263 RepID=A0AAD7DY36_MYCRO|nr:hypothetical protein B0H17DRAFT_1242322 [Mycena rosella]